MDDGIEVLSPTRQIVAEANNKGDWNHLSYVLRICYGKASIILPSDASIQVQKELTAVYGAYLRSAILKAPHHGRDSGYCEDFVKLVQPLYTVVSVGKKPENDASNKYKKHCPNVFSTRFCGTIYARLRFDGHVELFDHFGNQLESATDKIFRSALGALLQGR